MLPSLSRLCHPAPTGVIWTSDKWIAECPICFKPLFCNAVVREQEGEKEVQMTPCRNEALPRRRKNVVSISGCQHMFHTKCMHGWLIRRNLCPVCRGPVSQLDIDQITADVEDGGDDADSAVTEEEIEDRDQADSNDSDSENYETVNPGILNLQIQESVGRRRAC